MATDSIVSISLNSFKSP